MIMRVDDLAFTTPSSLEKENTFFLSLKNWNEVGRSLSLTMLRRRLVVWSSYTSPKWTDLLERYTENPVAWPEQLNSSSLPPWVTTLKFVTDTMSTI